jgi:hypothetical protein
VRLGAHAGETQWARAAQEPKEHRLTLVVEVLPEQDGGGRFARVGLRLGRASKGRQPQLPGLCFAARPGESLAAELQPQPRRKAPRLLCLSARFWPPGVVDVHRDGVGQANARAVLFGQRQQQRRIGPVRKAHEPRPCLPWIAGRGPAKASSDFGHVEGRNTPRHRGIVGDVWRLLHAKAIVPPLASR